MKEGEEIEKVRRGIRRGRGKEGERGGGWNVVI